MLSNMRNEFTGCGPFLHDDPRDRMSGTCDGQTTIHIGEELDNFVLFPIVPSS
jgi:uncharacterized protein